MISPIYFGIGFVIYIIFNTLTFKAYSKTPGITKKFILLIIYAYYLLLAVYIINFVGIKLDSSTFEITIQSCIFILIGTITLYFNNQDLITGEKKENIKEKYQY